MKIIEAVGLAGVGKSTLTDYLIDTLPDSYGRYRLRRSEQISRLFISLYYCAPLLVRFLFRKNVRNPYTALLQFEASIRDLEMLKKKENGFLILDQGPIYGYVSLFIYELNINGFSGLKKRFEKSFKKYAQLVDGVIYLYAPHDVLIKRVQERGTMHQLEDLDVKERIEFYNQYDSKYLKIIDEFSNDYDVSICNINTNENNVQHVKVSADEFIRSL